MKMGRVRDFAGENSYGHGAASSQFLTFSVGIFSVTLSIPTRQF